VATTLGGSVVRGVKRVSFISLRFCLIAFARLSNGPNTGPFTGPMSAKPETPGIWLYMAGSGDRKLASFSQV